MRKIRCDSKLHAMKAEQKDLLADWLMEGLGYEKAPALILAEFGVTTSKRAVENFYHSYCWPRELAVTLDRRLAAASQAKAIADEARKHPARFSEAAVELLQQKAFEMLCGRDSKAKDIRDIMSIVQKDNDQAMEKRKMEHAIRVYEDKMESVKSALLEVDKSEAGLSPETLEKIERAMRML